MSARGGRHWRERGGRGGGEGHDPLTIRSGPGSQGPNPGGAEEAGALGDDEYTKGSSIYRPEGEIRVPYPSPNVTAKEDRDTASFAGSSTRSSVQHLDLSLRPKYGRVLNVKDNIVLRTNYFAVDLAMKKELSKYKVTFEAVSNKVPALKNGRKRRQLYNILFEQRDFRNLGEGKATDYAETLITCGRLYEKSLPNKKYAVVYRNESEELREGTEDAGPNERNYIVTVTYSSMVPISELLRYMDSFPNDPSDLNARLDTIQAINIIVAGSPNKDGTVFQAGQNKFFLYPRGNWEKTFSPEYDNRDLGGGLIAVRGYFSSIRTSTSRILLNLNAQCSAFYPEINLRELMYRFVGGNRIPTWKLPDLEQFIRRLRVTTEQLTREGEVTREKTVWGFSHRYVQVLKQGRPVLNEDGSSKMKGTQGARHDYENSNSITFLDPFSPPRVVSVSEYFSLHYHQPLKFPEDPVVNCGTDESPRWIPAERCTVMPGQPYRGTLSDNQTTNMLTVAARGPAENARRITKAGVRVIGIQPRSRTLDAFGITINPTMLTVHGRILTPPQIQYNTRRKNPIHAEWNMTGLNFHEVASMSGWSYLCVGKATLPNVSLKQFTGALALCGIEDATPSPPNGFRIVLEGSGDGDRNDKAIHNALNSVWKAKIPILLVILDSPSAAIYARIKYWADTKFGIHTVCVLERKLNWYTDKAGPARTYFVNVLHKFNLKLGGINHRLVESELSDMPEKTMVVGIGVAHPTPGSIENSPSIVGMVASIDRLFAHWPGSFRIQESRQEIQKRRQEKKKTTGEDDIPKDKADMVYNIEALLRERLSAFESRNQKYPKNILIYRDGVSEGQYPAVLDLELKPMKQMCAELYRSENLEPPKFTIVIVGKRHHTRFYPTSSEHADAKHGYNPRPGTVVDRGITMQKGWDFYLQAHAALKGTARPAHYVVIHNDMQLKPDELEKITHNLSYLYERATKAVSYCPPAYYADKLCERGRCYLAKYVSTRGRAPGARFDPHAKDVPWKKNVHQNLEDSMFYI